MAQPEPKDKVTLESVFKLIEQLAPDEQQQLGQTLNKLQALRDAVDVGIKQLDQGLGIPDQDNSVSKSSRRFRGNWRLHRQR
jgi:phage-related protein